MFSNLKKLVVVALFSIVLSSQVVALSNDTSLACACQRPKPANQQ